MKLKHNSIRSRSRVKSSALIVCWQALPAPKQTQCYQGTEGRFVCTGRASCSVRPACPEVWGAVGCTAKDRGCQGPEEAGSTPAAPARSSVPGRGALAGGHIQPPCSALWPGETGQVASSECQHRVKTTEGQDPRVISAYGNRHGLIFHECCSAPWPGGCQAGRSWRPTPWQSSPVAPPDPTQNSQSHCIAWTASCFDLCLLPGCALVAAGPAQPSQSFFIYPCYF